MRDQDDYISDAAQHLCLYCEHTCDCGSGPEADDMSYGCLGCDDCTVSADAELPERIEAEYEARYLASMQRVCWDDEGEF